MVRNSWTSLIASGGALISAAIPENRFKEFLRARYWGRLDPFLKLNSMVIKAELANNGLLLVEMDDGTRFYGRPDYDVNPNFVRPDVLQRLEKIKNFENYGGFLRTLCDQYVDIMYERHYSIRPGDTVVDAGANIGTFTVRASRIVGDTGMVIAIEPEMSNISLLEANLEANGLRNVIVVPKGLWSSPARMQLNISPWTVGHSLLQDNYYGTKDADATQGIDVDTLDNILGALEVDRVDFIKMDVEGAEVEALKGMRGVMGHAGIRLAIGAEHIIDGERGYDLVAPQLKEMGFLVRREGEMVYAKKNADH